MTARKWQAKLPTEPGLWWFYGELWRPIGRPKPEIEVVRVQKISNGYAYVAHGTFVSEYEGMQGLWAKMDLPKLPEFKYRFKEQLYWCLNEDCVAGKKDDRSWMPEFQLKKCAEDGKLLCPYCLSYVEPVVDALSEFPKED